MLFSYQNDIFRVVEKGDVLCVEERFSENIKTYSVKLDEEYNYSEPGRVYSFLIEIALQILVFLFSLED